MGLYDAERPCVTVTGCCHLLTRAALRHASVHVSRFDIAFSPSQFDDAARDLHSALAGLPAVCAGQLRVRHLQHSSLTQSQNALSGGPHPRQQGGHGTAIHRAGRPAPGQEDATRTLDHLALVLRSAGEMED